MRAIEELRRMMEEVGFFGPQNLGPLEATTETGTHQAAVWAGDGDPVLLAAPHPMLDQSAVARVAARGLTLLPALLDVAEAAREYRDIQDEIERIDSPAYVYTKGATYRERVLERGARATKHAIAKKTLREALARLEEGT